MSQITQLSPRPVWEIFDQITRVARPSKHEEHIRQYLVDFAARHSLECKTDAIGNVVIAKGATKSYQSHPTVILQSHMDMVCEKNGNIEFDFMHDPIRTIVDNGWVKADGTTLGADCGIGMASALAVLIDNDLQHPAIEALFTVDEETGLTGAFNLGKGMITGKYLLNLDSEDEGEMFIGCAGGIDTVATFTYRPESAPDNCRWLLITVDGLKGGHSGDNINDHLGNSNKIITRLLLPATRRYPTRIASIDGGNLRNAIPREATALIGIPEKNLAAFTRLVDTVRSEVKNELQYTDSGFRLTVAEAAKPQSVMDRRTQKRLLLAVESAANGVLAMSPTLKGLVETSTNLASIKFRAGNTVEVVSSQRSSIESAKADAAHTVGAAFESAGAKVRHGEGYPGWEPDPNGHLIEVTVECYERLFGHKPVVRAIHAGLECGLFLQKYPHLEMVSFGPTLRGVHSPDERLEIATVDLFWRHLTEVLKSL